MFKCKCWLTRLRAAACNPHAVRHRKARRASFVTSARGIVHAQLTDVTEIELQRFLRGSSFLKGQKIKVCGGQIKKGRILVLPNETTQTKIYCSRWHSTKTYQKNQRQNLDESSYLRWKCTYHAKLNILDMVQNKFMCHQHINIGEYSARKIYFFPGQRKNCEKSSY